ncbi:putative ribonuclease H-like domain-containing protein [Tanacetum coccineum]
MGILIWNCAVVSSTHYSTCQSNDSVGEPGTVSDHSVNDDPVSTQKTQPKVPTNTQTVDPSCAQHVKPPRQPIRTPVTSSPIPLHNRQNWNHRIQRDLGAGFSFERKPCFVCGSLSHLIKNCDYYEKKMAREAALKSKRVDHPLKHMEHRGIFDSGCSGHMTGNRAHLEDYQELSKVGSVTFGGSKGSISGKGTIRLGNLVFDDVAFVKELGHFNLFSISQICDKKLNVLFTEKECFVVSSDFKMPDENQVLLKVPRQHNMRLGHLNFKNLNKLVKDNLVRGLPSKSFKNDHTCVACQKGKQHKASCKAKIDRYVTHPLHTLHMDLFGPTSVRSINHASYCLVITDDCSRFCWVFFLAKKDETSGILKTFIRQIENQLNQKVKIIRSDNGTEFKNRVMLEFCGEKGIKQEFSNARTPQQNGVAERMNRTLIEAARTMLADSHLPTTFWAEAVNTACYTFNRVRVTKPQHKTPYELLFGHKPILSYIRPFGCHVTILNTLSPLGKFDGKSDEGFLVGYSVNSKAFRVYNLVTKRVEVNLHVNFLEEKPNVQGPPAMQEELLQFKLQQVWVLVDLPNGAKVIGTKWVYRNKKDERGVVVRNKARLVAQGNSKDFSSQCCQEDLQVPQGQTKLGIMVS